MDKFDDTVKKNTLPTMAFMDLDETAPQNTEPKSARASMDCDGQCLSGCSDKCITVSN